jgi:hypothetical protein
MAAALLEVLSHPEILLQIEGNEQSLSSKLAEVRGSNPTLPIFIITELLY